MTAAVDAMTLLQNARKVERRMFHGVPAYRKGGGRERLLLAESALRAIFLDYLQIPLPDVAPRTRKAARREAQTSCGARCLCRH